jgi:hypothetical protein
MKGTLVGIYENNKGYKCSIFEWKKVVTSKDVTINENKKPHTPCKCGKT